jgi:outer membrane PBP1 activator LpoA protein
MNEILQAVPPRGLRIVVGLAASALILAACASTPPPTASLTAAHTAITEAEKADAGHYAAPELGEAREKLRAADRAVEEKKMDSAQRLAEESLANAELASAKTGEAKGAAVNLEMTQSNAALVEEMQRKSGAPQ